MGLKTERFEKVIARFRERLESKVRLENEDDPSTSLRSRLNQYASIHLNNTSGECGFFSEVFYGLLDVFTRRKYYLPSFR